MPFRRSSLFIKKSHCLLPFEERNAFLVGGYGNGTAVPSTHKNSRVSVVMNFNFASAAVGWMKGILQKWGLSSLFFPWFLDVKRLDLTNKMMRTYPLNTATDTAFTRRTEQKSLLMQALLPDYVRRSVMI